MVYVDESTENLDEVRAYALSPVPATTLAAVKADFAVGAFADLSPLARLEVAPDAGTLHGYGVAEAAAKLRADPEWREPEALIFLDARTAEDRSVWFVGLPKTEEELEEEEGDAETADETKGDGQKAPGGLRPAPAAPAGRREKESAGAPPPVWMFRVYTFEVPSLCVNFSIANMDIQEVVSNIEDPETPYFICEDYTKETPPPCYVTADPGEFELSTDEGDRRNFMPVPKRVVRLKEHVAEKIRVLPHWTVGWEPKPADLEKIGLPAGSMRFAQPWDTKRWALPPGWKTPVQQKAVSQAVPQEG